MKNFITTLELTTENVKAIGTNLVAFKYNGKQRVGSIERVKGGAITLKHTVQSTERLGRPFGAYTLNKIEGKIAVGGQF